MRTLLLFCVFLSFSFLSGQETTYQLHTLDKTLIDNANAVVRLNEMTVELTKINEMNIKLRRVVTVLNNLGNTHAHTSIGYNKSVKVKQIQSVVYDAFGKEIDKIKRKEFKDVSSVDGGTLYSDSRVLYMDYTPVNYPYTIEFSYEITTANTSNIPDWYFLDGFLVSTEKSKYSVIYSEAELKPEIKEKHFGDLEIRKTTSENSIVYEGLNIKAIKKETLSPSFNKIAPLLMVRAINFQYEGYNATIKDWDDLGIWMHKNILQGRDELSEETKVKAHSLVEGITDDLEKAKKIYEYVQNNTRYISVQVGIGGIQPIHAIEVDRVKYGDCKGLSNYTKALLDEVGVKSYYTHVEAGQDKINFEKDFASLAQGNHVILAIPYEGSYYWIDCTTQIHPFGFIGDFTDGRNVLIIKPEGGEIVKTATYLNKENRQKTKAILSLSENGSIEGDVKIDSYGIQYDNRFYLEDQVKDDIIKYYKQYWRNINNLKVKEYQFSNNKDSIVFTEQLTLNASDYATKSGDRLLVAINAFNQNRYVPNRHRNRKMPFEIQRGFFDEDEFEVIIPEAYEIEAIPNNTSFENEFGYYTTTIEVSENKKTLLYNRSLLIKEGWYAKEKYNAYRDFRKKIANTDNAQLILIKTK